MAHCSAVQQVWVSVKRGLEGGEGVSNTLDRARVRWGHTGCIYPSCAVTTSGCIYNLIAQVHEQYSCVRARVHDAVQCTLRRTSLPAKQVAPHTYADLKQRSRGDSFFYSARQGCTHTTGVGVIR